MELFPLLKRLTEEQGISGAEGAFAQKLCEEIKPYFDTVKIEHGNVIGTIGTAEGKPCVLLDAHMDKIGFVVTSITEDGFLRVSNIGGLDMRLMPAQRVMVHGTKTLHGVIGSIPPHLQNGDSGIPKCEELFVDMGMTKEELETCVSIGDSVEFFVETREVQNHCVIGGALDDRCGIAAILCAIQQVQGETLPCQVSVLFSTQEEVGERGARMGGYTIHPDYAIAVDVSFAMSRGHNPMDCGVLGAGPMIGVSPTLSREVSNDLIALAKEQNIPWQYEVMNGTTGTNADQFSVTAGGCKTCTVSIPLRYMHTSAELISMEDVEHTADLLAAFLRGCKA